MRTLVLLVSAATLLAACIATRAPLEVTAAALAEASTPEARASAVAARLHDAGTTPLGDGRVRPHPTDVRALSTPAVVAGLVPGQDPALRTELVTLAAPLDSPVAAEVVETARALVARRPHTAPRRSVLVALWPAGRPAAEGPAAVRAMRVWADSLHGPTLVVGEGALDTGGRTGEALVAHLLAGVLAVADAPPARDTSAADTVAVR